MGTMESKDSRAYIRFLIQAAQAKKFGCLNQGTNKLFQIS
jgi:hypothetical protein